MIMRLSCPEGTDWTLTIIKASLGGNNFLPSYSNGGEITTIRDIV